MSECACDWQAVVIEREREMVISRDSERERFVIGARTRTRADHICRA